MAGPVLGRTTAERQESKQAVCIERWTCPECGVPGQTSSLAPGATNITAHFERIHPGYIPHPSTKSRS